MRRFRQTNDQARRRGARDGRRSQAPATPSAPPRASISQAHQIIDRHRRVRARPRCACARRRRLAIDGRDLAFRLAPDGSLLHDRLQHGDDVGVSVTGVAPCLMRPFVPSARGSSGEPGTAKTSRPCSSAKRAVIREPERLRRLDHDDAERQPGNQPVAARESRARAAPAERHFRDAAPADKIASSSSTCSAG